MARGARQLTTKKDGNRPPINGDTPVANKTLGQCLNAMLDTSSWIQLFAPKAARQAVWAELVEETQSSCELDEYELTEDSVSLLMAMGMEAHAYPSSTALADWTASKAGTELQRRKRKLETAFGSKERLNPANIPLPRTPKETTRAVFGSAELSPYLHDSHMVTPRSESRKARVAHEVEQTESNTRPGTRRSSSRRQAAADNSSSDEDNPFY
ncbi:LOW QUALITY PROTEIN: Eukaryotic/viral aspartic protease [Phytophthora megakarya]|uniref:Eukaryotic/viral aspartic protease n=1 Tax=Phytophthora megakarya TaxID=4795 RepID=A0A225UPF8_9STRA|nr:LOW QUALITY PROTEIN: Eukaryotic/viral aspartic protease [Phytophthora megakarya]